MRNLIALLIFSALTYSSLFAQNDKTVYVLDGYTLEPLTDFKVVSENDKLSYTVDLNTIIVRQHATGTLTVIKEGYINTTIKVFGKSDQNIIVNPSDEQRIALRAKYIVTENPIVDEEEIFSIVEEPALFPGESGAIGQFLSKNLRYPLDEIELEIEGRIYVKFVVEPDGSVSNISIAKGLTKNTELETIRVLKLMPKWIPGKKDGIPVRCYFVLPLTFKLS